GGLGRRGGGRTVGGGGGGVELPERHIDHAAGVEAQALGDQVQVVVMDPDGGEVGGHAERHAVLGGFEAHHGLEPHLKNILGKQLLEIAFYGFPKAGGEGQRRHVAGERSGLFTLSSGGSPGHAG